VIEAISLLARSRRLVLAGAEIETPLLVPSISSKAIGPIELGQVGHGDQIVPASQVHSETLIHGMDEAVLISAYDVHFRYITSTDSLRTRFASSIYSKPKVLFIDSGWYEKSVGPASGPWYYEVGDAQAFEQTDHTALIDSLDPDMQAVVVGWDKEGTYREQIDAAQEFFATRPRFSSEILMKPERTRRYHNFSELSVATAQRLQAFDVIGVTEKDLGDTILKRLTALAELRARLDDANVLQPIHVFGGLDPLTTPLYFAAGAEVLDGLSWIRYAYRDGMCVHREVAPLIDHQYEKKLSVAVSQVQLSNLDALTELSRELKVFFHNDCDWTKLRRGELFQHAAEAMESDIRSKRGR
jgi:hypothetical protein